MMPPFGIIAIISYNNPMELCSFAKIIPIVFMVFILELLCHPGDLEFLQVIWDLFCPLTKLFTC